MVWNAIKYIIETILGIIVIIFLSLFFYFNEELKLPETIFIPKGSIGQIISHIGKEIDVSFSPLDKYVVAYFGQPQSGLIQLSSTKMSRIKFLEEITKAKAPPSTKIVTLVPGETTEYFIHSLAERFQKDGEELYKYFLSNSPMKEGFLIPDSYHINSQNNLKIFIKKLISYSKKKHREEMKKYNIKTIADLKRILIIASIIEKESASKNEMPIIASVIYNRLERGMKLQMDGTLNYGLYSHTKITADRIRKDKSNYNTYKISGLPDEAICNPSQNAVISAINPDETDFLYFVKLKNQRKHIFSTSYQAHLNEVQKLREH